jgi:hypothetical protein
MSHEMATDPSRAIETVSRSRVSCAISCSFVLIDPLERFDFGGQV